MDYGDGGDVCGGEMGGVDGVGNGIGKVVRGGDGGGVEGDF